MNRSVVLLALAACLWAVPSWSQNVVTRALRPLPETNLGSVSVAWDRTAQDVTPGIIMKVYIGLQPGVPFSVVCNSAVCYSLDPIVVPPGRQVISVTATLSGVEGPSSDNVVTVGLSSCKRAHPTTGVVEMFPVGTALPGGPVPFTKGTDLNYATTRVNALRLDGWRIEWQLALNSTGLWATGVCVGSPQ